jgi:hypothetical protein
MSMAKKNFRRFLACTFLLVVAMSGCKKIEITTTVHKDGSLERLYKVDVDSGRTVEGPFPVPSDSSWHLDWIKENDRHFLVSRKAFKNARLLDQEYAAFRDSTYKVHQSVKMDKKFRWLFTFVTFSETFQSYNPFTFLPVDGYLSQQDLALLKAGVDSSELEDKVEQWMQRAAFEEIYHNIKQSALELHDPAINEEVFSHHKDELYHLIIDSSENNDALADKTVTFLNRIFKTTSFGQMKGSIQRYFDEIEQSMYFIMEVGTDDYEANIIMPGAIIGTNADEIEGNKVSWKIHPMRFFVEDYDLWVESRIVNTWAIVVTVVVLIAMAVVLVLTSKHK